MLRSSDNSFLQNNIKSIRNDSSFVQRIVMDVVLLLLLIRNVLIEMARRDATHHQPRSYSIYNFGCWQLQWHVHDGFSNQKVSIWLNRKMSPVEIT